MPVLKIIDLESFVNLEKILPSYHRNQYRNSLNIHLLYNVRNIIRTVRTLMIKYDRSNRYSSGMVPYWYSSRLETFTFHSNILALEYIIKLVLDVRSHIPYILIHLFVRTYIPML